MRRPGPIVTRRLSASVSPRIPNHSAPGPPHAVATSRPTAEFGQHHTVNPPRVDGRVFRQGWRVATRLDGLLEAGRIDREAWDAAHTWRRWAETVTPFRQQCWDVRVDVSAVPSDTGALIRTVAATKLREVAAGLGELRVRILEAVVVRDMSFSELGRLLRLSDKTAREWAAEAIEALAEHCAGRAVAPPRVQRYRIEPRRQ